MFNETLMSTALRAARGMNFASGAATKMIISSVIPWIMPAMGVRPPHFHIQGVRADRARYGNAAKERRHDIGDSLGHQFLIRIMLVVNHAIGHHRAQQRLNCRQQRRWSGLSAETDADVFLFEEAAVLMPLKRRGAVLAGCRQIWSQSSRPECENGPRPPSLPPARRWEPGTRRCHGLGQSLIIPSETAARSNVGH